LQPYPQAEQTDIDSSAEAEIRWLQTLLLGIRRIRGEMNIAPSKPLPILLQNGSDQDKARLSAMRSFIDFLGRPESIAWLETDEAAPESAIALVGEMKLMVPMAGLIDKEAE